MFFRGTSKQAAFHLKRRAWDGGKGDRRKRTCEKAVRKLLVPAYGAGYLFRDVPKYWLPGEELPPEVAYRIVRDELILEGDSRQDPPAFCTA